MTSKSATDPLFDVEGYVTPVTGGSSGSSGSKDTLFDRNASALETVLAEAASDGLDIAGYLIDVSDRAALSTAIDNVAQAHGGRLDMLFANAAVNKPPGFPSLDSTRCEEDAVENIPDALWDRFFAINVFGLLMSLRRAIRIMKRQPDGGRIVVTSSGAAFRPEPFEGSAYMPSKAVGASLAEIEVPKYLIHVNRGVPGTIATNIGGGFIKDKEKSRNFIKKVPMGRADEPEELTAVVLLLGSRQGSAHMTRSQTKGDGGILLGSAD